MGLAGMAVDAEVASARAAWLALGERTLCTFGLALSAGERFCPLFLV